MKQLRLNGRIRRCASSLLATKDFFGKDIKVPTIKDHVSTICHKILILHSIKTNNMRIRNFQKTDFQGCIDIFSSNCPKYFDEKELNFFNKYLEARSQHVIFNPIQSEADYYFVAEEKNKIFGCGGFYKIKDANQVQFAWGMILNSFHNKGLGTLLTNYRLENIKTLYPEAKITLGTSQFTYPFFEKKGFQITNFYPDGYGEGLDRYDMEYINSL